SPCTSSRTEAPLAQCEPRLRGLSQLGSWPIHTPFATSAVTVQPTEQCVQMLLRMVTCAPGGGGGPACAFRTPLSGSAPREATPRPLHRHRCQACEENHVFRAPTLLHFSSAHLLLCVTVPHDGSAKASVSSCMNTRPSIPAARYKSAACACSRSVKKRPIHGAT